MAYFYAMQNGIKIIYLHEPSRKTFGCAIMSRVGSRHESDNMHGITHLAEHVMMQGGQNCPDSKMIKRTIQRLGDNVNAGTAKDTVLIHGKFASESMVEAFGLLADLFTRPTFEQQYVDQEKVIVVNEIGQYEDDHMTMCIEANQKSYFEGGLSHQILGTREDVLSYSPKVIRDWWYSTVTDAQNLIVTAYGPAPVEVFVDMVKSEMSSIVGKETIVTTPNNFRSGNRQVQTEADATMNYLSMLFPSRAASCPMIKRTELLGQMLGGSMNSVLYKEVRDKMGAAYHISADYESYKHEGTFSIIGIHDPTKEVEEKVLHIVKNFSAYVSEEDFNAAKESSLASLAIQFDDPFSTILHYTYCEMHNAPILSFEEKKERYQAITFKDVLEEAEKIFSHEPCTHIISGC